MIYHQRNLSFMSVVVLSLSNMILTFLLLQSKSCRLSNKEPEKIIQHTVTVENTVDYDSKQPPCRTHEPIFDQTIFNLDVRLGKLDNRRQFKTFDSVLVGTKFSELSESHIVCLATQTSLEKIHSLVQVAHHWTASISVALYTAGDEEFEALQTYLSYLRKCYIPILERINFSLAVPKKKSPTKQPRHYEPPEDHDCSRPEATLNDLVNKISIEQTSWRSRNIYPQNHMRNLARKNCQSDWVFLTDIDIIPSVGMATSLDRFLRNTQKCDKCAYVVPTYEIDTRVRFPRNKTELIRLAKKGLARPFHWKVFIHNQYATNFTRWMLDVSPSSNQYKKVIEGTTFISHNVTNFEFLYEPFYISRDVVPVHDERFMGYGYTRNTQVYEMFVAGYKFKVLSPVFTIHWGLQTRKNRSAWRERQNILNRRQFEQFKKEVFERYLHESVEVTKSV